MNILERAIDIYGEDLMGLDGFDECLAGVVVRAGQNPILCYDILAIIQTLMDGGMTSEAAWEYFEFNQLGAWVGNDTPCFLHNLDRN
jgi:hypothetical protein